MKRALGCLILVLTSTFGIGCSVSPAPTQARLDADAHRLDRLQRAAASLAPASSNPALRLEVFESDCPSAYSWPDGRVAVASSLIDSLDDAELAAAIAHELGHLLNNGHVRGVAALKGSGPKTDVEAAADAAGVRLLLDAHLPPAAMSRMLTKVKDSPHTPADSRAPLAARIKRLQD